MKKFSQFISSNILYTNIIILILSIAIVPYIFLAFFSVPSADDFSQASNSLNQGILNYIIHRYLNWNGRYSSDIVISTYNVLGERVDSNFLIDFYYLVPLSLILIYCVANYLFFSLVSGIKEMKWKLILSLASTILMLSTVELRSTIFWLAGGATYTLGNSLFLISLGIILFTVYINSSSRWSVLLTNFNIVFIFFVNGFNETTMAANTVAISAMLFFNLIFKNLSRNESLRLIYFEISAIALRIIFATAIFMKMFGLSFSYISHPISKQSY